MENLNDTYWNNRYITNDFSWDIGHISPPLKTYIDQIANKELKISKTTLLMIQIF